MERDEKSGCEEKVCSRLVGGGERSDEVKLCKKNDSSRASR